jgi:hypothetical protein
MGMIVGLPGWPRGVIDEDVTPFFASLAQEHVGEPDAAAGQDVTGVEVALPRRPLRRPSKEYEYLPESSEAMIYLAMSRLMLRRLARQAPHGVPSPQRQGLRGLARAFQTAS